MVALLPSHVLIVQRGICIGRNDHVQSMLKTGLYCSIDAEVGHNATDHHVFFALCCQVLQQTTLFLECTAYGLDESFFSGHRLKLRIDLKRIVPDGKPSTRPIIVLNIANFYPMFSSGLNQLPDITDKLLERI